MGNSENNIPPQTNSSNDDLLEQNLPLVQNIQPSVPSNSQNGIEPNVQIANQSINYIQPSQALQQPQLPNNVYVQCNSIYPNVPTNSQDPPTYEQSMDTSAILALPEKNSQVLTPVIPQPQPQPQQTQTQTQTQNQTQNQNQNQEVILMINETQVPRQSFKMKCPHCNKTVDTVIQFEDNVLVWGLCVILFIYTCLCCIPFCITELKDAVHYCPICRNEIARRDRVI